jgi:succinate dehydrogenase hydrophobic anchor subunit
MSANSAAHGTKHFKMHSLSGWGVIIGLPFAVGSALLALGGGATGIVDWLSSPLGAIGLLAFLTAALLYCRLEMDEVIMDYFSGGLRSFGLLANKIVATILWAISAAGLINAAFL